MAVGGGVLSQAFVGEDGAGYEGGGHAHPQQQPVLQALLRPSALSRCVASEDFSKAFLEDENKHG